MFRNFILKLLLIILISIGVFFTFGSRKANATLCNANKPSYTLGYYCNYNSGTTWQFSTRYFKSRNGGSWTPYYYKWANQTGGSYCSGSPANWGTLDLGQYQPSANDQVKWLTACVDPVVDVGARSICSDPDGTLHVYDEDISCKSHTAASVTYGACGYNGPGTGGQNSTKAKNLGSVSFFGACPIPNQNPGNTFACSYAGTRGQTCAVGCNGTCTYTRCSGSSGACLATAYSNSCGGGNISGTNMCFPSGSTAYSKICSPPAPTVTLSAICNGINPNIRVNYSPNSGGAGSRSYDLRWRISGGSWNNVCSPPASGSGYDYVITSAALNDSTTYQVQVREHTDPGYNGPTNFGSATVTTPTCSGPLPPTCTLTANPTTISQGGTSALSANCTAGVGGGSVTYSWPPPSTGSLVDPSGTTAINTYVAPASVASPTTAVVSVTGCNTIGGNCATKTTNITVNPSTTYTISGNVFADLNSDGIDSGESNYTGAPAINITSDDDSTGATVGTITYPSSGSYLISNLPEGDYNITYTNPPTASGYRVTYPNGVGSPSFLVTVGSSCNTNSNKNAICSPAGSGNITDLDFGINNSIPWIQSIGGNITGTSFTTNNGVFNDQIPSGASQPYASVIPGGAVTPGIIFSGSIDPSFGQGQASVNNWAVGTSTYPEVYTPPIPNTIKTSYNYMTALIQGSGITPTPICSGGGDCTLTFAAGSHGVFSIDDDVNILGSGSPSSYTFPAGGQYVILVNGDLNIKTQLHVPIGGSVIFSSSGDINIDPSVGESSQSSSNIDLEGYYSADGNFIVNGTASCPAPDNRLNAAGAIVANASLGNSGFVNNRDLCAGNLLYPVFTITERPDFILNSTDFLKSTRRVWQEIAP